MPEANKNKLKPKAKLYFGNADELAKTNNYVTPEYLQEVDKRRKDWNEFIGFLKKENVAGSENLDKGGAGLGYLKKWNKANPDKAFTQEDIKDVQYYSRNTKKETGERVNDGILGKVTSTFSFPDSRVNTYEMKNGQKVLVKSEDPNIGNYQYQADKINFGIAGKNKADVSKLPIYNKNSATTDISWDKNDPTANNLLKEQAKKRSLSGQSLSKPEQFVKPLTATEYHPAVQEQLEGSYFDNNQKVVDYNQNLQQQKQAEVQQQADTRTALQKKLATSKSKDFTKEEALDYFNETGKVLPQNKVQGKYNKNKQNQIIGINDKPLYETESYRTLKDLGYNIKEGIKSSYRNAEWDMGSRAVASGIFGAMPAMIAPIPTLAAVGAWMAQPAVTGLGDGIAKTLKKKTKRIKNEEFGMPTFQDDNSDLTQKREGGVIKDNRGQWAHPGEITEIGSNNITMQGVNYPVLGVSDQGDTQMMYPEQNYQFRGNKVTEYPMMQEGGTVKPIVVNNPNDPRLRAYNDSNNLYNQGIEREKFYREHGMTKDKTHEFPFSRVTSYGYANKLKGKIQPISAISQELNPNHPSYYRAEFLKYKKPVQPYILENPITKQTATTEQIKPLYQAPQLTMPERLELSMNKPDVVQLAEGPMFKQGRQFMRESGINKDTQSFNRLPGYYEEGGKVNPLEGDLISKVIMNRNRDKNFVNRAYAVGQNPNMFTLQDPENFGDVMSHKMAWGTDDAGQAYMYPTIMNPNNEAIKVPNQYADYISSEGYKKATGMEYSDGGTINNMKKRTLKKYQYSYGGLTVTDLNKYDDGGAAATTGATVSPAAVGAGIGFGAEMVGALIPEKSYTDSEGNDLGSRKSIGESTLEYGAKGAGITAMLGGADFGLATALGAGYGAYKGWADKEEMDEKQKEANFNIDQRKLYNKMNTNVNWGNSNVNTSTNMMFAAGGMLLNQDDPNANAELELQETFQMPDGTVGNVDGPSHENGGIAVDLPEGTRIWSDKLKHNGKTFAKHTKPITNTIAKLEKQIEKNPVNSDAKENSIALLKNQLDYYFDTQETNKQNTEMKRTLREGGMIKRADGSYSKRGLWDNIRANKGSGKKPTPEMLKQERKINNEMAMGGYMYGNGGTNNPGFNALPESVQENILNNMGMGGEIYGNNKPAFTIPNSLRNISGITGQSLGDYHNNYAKRISDPRYQQIESAIENSDPYKYINLSNYSNMYSLGGRLMNDPMFAEGGIHIKPENRGKFTAYAESHGKGVQEMAAHIMANKEDYSPAVVKRANFAKNAAGWKHEMGGMVEYQRGGRRLNLETPTNNMEQRWIKPEDNTPQEIIPYFEDPGFDINAIDPALSYNNPANPMIYNPNYVQPAAFDPFNVPKWTDMNNPMDRIQKTLGNKLVPTLPQRVGTGNYGEFYNPKRGQDYTNAVVQNSQVTPTEIQQANAMGNFPTGVNNPVNPETTPEATGFFNKAGQFIQKNPGLIGQLGTAALTAGTQMNRINRLARPKTLADVRLRDSVANPNLVDYSAERNAIDRAALTGMGEAQRGFGSSAAAQAFKNKARLNQLEGTGRSFQGQENANAQIKNQFLAARQEAAMKEAMMNNEIGKYNLENVYGYDTMTTAQKNAITAMLGNTAGQTFGKQTDYANQLQKANILANQYDPSVLNDMIKNGKLKVVDGQIVKARNGGMIQYAEGGEVNPYKRTLNKVTNFNTSKAAETMDAEYAAAMAANQDKYTSSVTGLDYKVLPKAEKRALVMDMWRDTHGEAPSQKQIESGVKAIEGKKVSSAKAKEVANVANSQESMQDMISKKWPTGTYTPATPEPEGPSMMERGEQFYEEQVAPAARTLKKNFQEGVEKGYGDLKDAYGKAKTMGKQAYASLENAEYPDVAVGSKMDIKTKGEDGAKSLPLPLTMLSRDLLSKVKNKTITENDLTKGELETLKMTINGVKKATGRDYLKYADYDNKKGSKMSSLDLMREIVSNYDNQKLKFSFGQGNFRQDGDSTIFEDTYNFNDRNNEGYLDNVSNRLNKGDNALYAPFRALGTTYGSPEGQGNKVRVAMYNPKGKKSLKK